MKARIGELLRRWRALRDMSRADLADRAGVSTRHISFIENGRTQPTRDMLSWLAQALAVPATEHVTFLEAAGYKRPAVLARIELTSPGGRTSWDCATLTLGPPNDVQLRELRVAIFLAVGPP